MVGVEPVAFDEEFQPAIPLGFDTFNPAFAQFQQPDTAVFEQAAALVVAQAEAVDRFGNPGPQGLTQQPDSVGRLVTASIATDAVRQLTASYCYW